MVAGGIGGPRLPMKGRLQNPESKARDCPGCGRTYKRPQLPSLWPPPYPPHGHVPVKLDHGQEARQLSTYTATGVYKVRQPCGQPGRGAPGRETVLSPWRPSITPAGCWSCSSRRRSGGEGAGRRPLGNCIPGDLAGALRSFYEPQEPSHTRALVVHGEFQAQYGQAMKLLLSCNWILQAAVEF